MFYQCADCYANQKLRSLFTSRDEPREEIEHPKWSEDTNDRGPVVCTPSIMVIEGKKQAQRQADNERSDDWPNRAVFRRKVHDYPYEKHPSPTTTYFGGITAHDQDDGRLDIS